MHGCSNSVCSWKLFSATLVRSCAQAISQLLIVQSFITKTSKRTKLPQFDAERNVVIMKSAHVIHLMVHRLKGSKFLALKRTPIGVATIDVRSLFPNLESSGGESSKSVNITLRMPEASQVREDINKALPRRKALCKDEPAHAAVDPDPVIGTVSVVIEKTCIEQLKQSFWSGLMEIVDWDDSGTLDREVSCPFSLYFVSSLIFQCTSPSTLSA
jgi:hypothetical protein